MGYSSRLYALISTCLHHGKALSHVAIDFHQRSMGFSVRQDVMDMGVDQAADKCLVRKWFMPESDIVDLAVSTSQHTPSSAWET